MLVFRDESKRWTKAFRDGSIIRVYKMAGKPNLRSRDRMNFLWFCVTCAMLYLAKCPERKKKQAHEEGLVDGVESIQSWGKGREAAGFEFPGPTAPVRNGCMVHNHQRGEERSEIV